MLLNMYSIRYCYCETRLKRHLFLLLRGTLFLLSLVMMFYYLVMKLCCSSATWQVETYCIVCRGLLNPLFYEDPAFFSFFFSMKISDSSFSEQPSILPARFLLEKSEPCFGGKFQKLNLPFVKLGSNYVLKVFMWGTHLDMSFFSTIPVYLRNLTSSGHNF